MTKPRILVIDWKPKECYTKVKDLVDIQFTIDDNPETLEGIAAIVLHNPSTEEQVLNLVTKSEPYGIPIILQGGPQQRASKILFGELNRVKIIDSYENLFDYIRDIFK